MKNRFVGGVAFLLLISQPIFLQPKANENPLKSLLFSDGLIAGRYEGFSGAVDAALPSLEYTTSKSLRVSIPKTNYVVVFDWGFAGSGDHDIELMMPLPSVKAQLEHDEVARLFAPGKESVFLDLARVCVENELGKFARRSGDDFELTPRWIFLLKFILLAQHTIQHKDMGFFFSELLNLSRRYVLSGDLALLQSDSQAPLSSILPDSFVAQINKRMPLLLPLADQMLISTRALLTSTDDLVSGSKVFTYVFTDEAKAAEFKAFAHKTLNRPDCVQVWDEFIEAKDLQVLDYDVFFDQKTKEAESGIKTPFNFLVGKIVTDDTNTKDLVDFGVLASSDVAGLSHQESVCSFSKGAFIVVCCRTAHADLDAQETFAAIAKSFVRAWRLYAEIICSEAEQGNDLGANEVLLEDASEREELRKFFQTEDGACLQENLEKALAAVRDPFQKVKVKHDSVLRELEAKEVEFGQVTDSLEESEQLLLKLQSKNKSQVTAKAIARTTEQIKSFKEQLEKINEAINLLQVELDSLENGENSKNIEMEEIAKALLAQRKSGLPLDVDMRRRLEALQNDFTMKSQDKVQVELSDEDKLDVRQAVLGVYETELKGVHAQLAPLEEAMDRGFISVADLGRESRLSTYSRFLERRINLMREQNSKLKTLIAFRASLKEVGVLAPERMTQYYQLVDAVGFILDANDSIEICRVTKPTPSAVKRFVNIFINPTALPVFEPVLKAFVDDCAGVVARSGFLRENSVLVKYLLERVSPLLREKIIKKASKISQNRNPVARVDNGYADKDGELVALQKVEQAAAAA